MEDLNKNQLILLTLLVSFVTSIATGIITFTMLQEAPVEVTQTINRVVERTIETVAPDAGGREVVREVQVVNEEDLVLESIDKSVGSIVRVKTIGFDGVEIVASLGLVVAEKIIVMDARAFSQGSNYTIVFADGKSYNAANSYISDRLAFVKVGVPQNEQYTFHPATLGNADSLKLGQTIIAVGGKESNSVSISRVSKKEIVSGGATTKIITDVPVSKSQIGSPLLNLSGEIVGLEAPIAEGNDFLSYVPASSIKNALKAAVAELSK